MKQLHLISHLTIGWLYWTVVGRGVAAFQDSSRQTWTWIRPSPSPPHVKQIRYLEQHRPLARHCLDLSNDKKDNLERLDEDAITGLGSLDEVLQKARKRSTNLWFYRIRAFFNQPLWIIPRPFSATFTIGDVSLILGALWIDAKGFALGLVIGKVTASPLRDIFNLPPNAVIILLPLWPGLWAIFLDQFFQ